MRWRKHHSDIVCTPEHFILYVLEKNAKDTSSPLLPLITKLKTQNLKDRLCSTIAQMLEKMLRYTERYVLRVIFTINYLFYKVPFL